MVMSNHHTHRGRAQYRGSAEGKTDRWRLLLGEALWTLRHPWLSCDTFEKAHVRFCRDRAARLEGVCEVMVSIFPAGWLTAATAVLVWTVYRLPKD